MVHYDLNNLVLKKQSKKTRYFMWDCNVHAENYMNNAGNKLYDGETSKILFFR